MGRKVVSMAGTKNKKGATLDQQIAKLEKIVGQGGVDIARKMIVGDQRNIVRLASKYIGLERANRGGMTARQAVTYNQLLASNKQVAEEWKAARVKENAERKAKKAAAKA